MKIFYLLIYLLVIENSFLCQEYLNKKLKFADGDYESFCS